MKNQWETSFFFGGGLFQIDSVLLISSYHLWLLKRMHHINLGTYNQTLQPKQILGKQLIVKTLYLQ